jgi:hypothetical protein
LRFGGANLMAKIVSSLTQHFTDEKNNITRISISNLVTNLCTGRHWLPPHEGHGYAAKENILHMLWEQHNWLEQHVKKVRE